MSRAPRKLADPRPTANEPLPDDDRVGYGKPPKHTRFRKGHSGNPKGRPKDSLNLRTELRAAFAERATIRDGDRLRKVPALRVLVRRLMANAMKGDQKALNAIFLLLARLFPDAFNDTSPANAPAPVSQEDLDLIEDFVRRAGGTFAGTDGKGISAPATSRRKGKEP